MPKFSEIPQFTKSANYRVDMPWDFAFEWIQTKDFTVDLNPDFQRAHVWIEEQQIRYVEFILRGGKSSRDIYWNCATWMSSFNTPLVLVDGKQRLRAAERFINNEIPAFGYLRKEYEDKLGFHAAFVFYVNDLRTRAEVLQWYLDLNDGGVIHTRDEIDKVRRLLKKEQKKVSG